MLLPGQPTLNSLDSVPWSSSRHVYGSADDVPGQNILDLLAYPDEHSLTFLKGRLVPKIGVLSSSR